MSEEKKPTFRRPGASPQPEEVAGEEWRSAAIQTALINRERELEKLNEQTNPLFYDNPFS